MASWGGLFLPDPSIGRWALWRQPVGASAFSLIGQIHTLSTPAALSHLQDLVSEPVQPWDAVICSSTAGRSVVEAVLNSREEALAERSGGDVARLRASRPQLPVIPLPLPDSAMAVPALDKRRARKALGLPETASVVLWLGTTCRSTPSSIHGRPTQSWSVWPGDSITLLCFWSVGPMTNHPRRWRSLALRECVPMCTSSVWVVLSR